MADPAARPATLLPPPLVYATGLAAGWFINRIVPLGFAASPLLNRLGWGLVSAGVLLTMWAALTIWRHRTTINPYKAVSTLVATGPFAFSRNPIYLGDWLVYAGVTLLLETYWTLALAPAVWWVMRYHVIAHEEAHLTARFGQAYRDYTSKVRRWI
ncbi:MAG TPA: isoprenylcysteine carboxylmethyltransferase family protein [Thiobacillaceae bacterium]|nr:isoprenylcysteine carboxylmethyltransferase family protein [Thiobacillaceae bacterium]